MSVATGGRCSRRDEHVCSLFELSRAGVMSSREGVLVSHDGVVSSRDGEGQKGHLGFFNLGKGYLGLGKIRIAPSDNFWVFGTSITVARVVIPNFDDCSVVTRWCAYLRRIVLDIISMFTVEVRKSLA